MIYNLPKHRLLADESGYLVEIQSVGGFFQKDRGIVLYGPFQYDYTIKSKGGKTEEKTSCIQYQIFVERLNRSFGFMKSEITLLNHVCSVSSTLKKHQVSNISFWEINSFCLSAGNHYPKG